MHFGSLASKRKLPSQIKPVPRETILRCWNNNFPRRQYSIKQTTFQFLEHRQESNVKNKIKRANSFRNEKWWRTNLLLTVQIGICCPITQPMAPRNHLLKNLFRNRLLLKHLKIWPIKLKQELRKKSNRNSCPISQNTSVRKFNLPNKSLRFSHKFFILILTTFCLKWLESKYKWHPRREYTRQPPKT